MSDDLPILSKADVIGYEMRRDLLDAGIPDPREGMRIEPSYGQPYYSVIEVMPDVGGRIFGANEIVFAEQYSRIVGQSMNTEGKPWRFQLHPITDPLRARR